jgi:hypothetical protein
MKLIRSVVWLSLMSIPVVAVSISLPPNKIFINDGTVALNVETQIKNLKDLKVDSKGHIWITDAMRRVVLKYEKNGALLRGIDRFANEPRFKRPLGLFIDKQDNVYVADGARSRIYVFTSAGEPIRALPMKHDLQTLRINSRGEFVVGGFNGEEFPRNGFYLSHYDHSLHFIRRFEPADEKLERLNLSYFDGILFDIDRQDNIYCFQPVSYKLRKYNREGRLLSVMSGQNRHYRPPPRLAEETYKDKQKFAAWVRSWTPMVALHITKQGLLVVQFMERADKFWTDIYTLDGRPLHTEVSTPYRLLGIDSQDRLYFLINKAPYILGKFRLELHSEGRKVSASGRNGK